MAIPIRFITVVLKKEAVEVTYPGGLPQLLIDWPEIPMDDHLVGIPFMSSGEVGSFLDLLRSLGMNFESSGAVGEMLAGPTIRCAGIHFYSLLPDAPFDKEWRAVLTCPPVLACPL